MKFFVFSYGEICYIHESQLIKNEYTYLTYYREAFLIHTLPMIALLKLKSLKDQSPLHP